VSPPYLLGISFALEALQTEVGGRSPEFYNVLQATKKELGINTQFFKWCLRHAGESLFLNPKHLKIK
jgi:hypothetical protein